MYVNVCGGVMREVTSCMSGEGRKGTWDRCQVRLISELTHLVIKSDGDHSAALVRDANRHHVP